MEHSSRVVEEVATSACGKSNWLIGIPIAVLYFHSLTLGIILLGLWAAIDIALAWRRSQIRRRKLREMLCETQYAKEQGFRPESLQLWSLPWPHNRRSAQLR